MTETTKFIITIIAATIGSGVGTAIVGAWLKKRFDAQLQETQNRFAIGITSHMADVAFDKHVAFCEEYATAVNEALTTLFRSGVRSNILQNAYTLVDVRAKWTLWIDPEVEPKLKVFEDALRTIGANATVLEAYAAQTKQTGQPVQGSEVITKAYETFAGVMGYGTWQGKPVTGTPAAEQIIEGLRGVLGISDLRRLRAEMIERAVK